MPWFVTHYIKTSEQLQALLETALQEGHTEVVSWLMNEKHERFGGESVRRRRFEL